MAGGLMVGSQIALEFKKENEIVSFRTTVHNHCIEVPSSQTIPDGTEVIVQLTPVNQSTELMDGNWDDTPEGIADWFNWLDSLEPFILTEQEQSLIETERQRQKEWEKGQFFGHANQLAGEWT